MNLVSKYLELRTKVENNNQTTLGMVEPVTLWIQIQKKHAPMLFGVV